MDDGSRVHCKDGVIPWSLARSGKLATSSKPDQHKTQTKHKSNPTLTQINHKVAATPGGLEPITAEITDPLVGQLSVIRDNNLLVELWKNAQSLI